jgi:SAM-dependent methyltransferase
MHRDTDSQLIAADNAYRRSDPERWGFHFTDDPLIRYLRDRRLHLAMRILRSMGRLDPREQSALVVCGGVGGEGAFLRNIGFADVTVSDFSREALRLGQQFNPDIKALQLNAEALDLADASYDVVLVQDGLHHLSRPVVGLTEMLRVARDSVIVIEPHLSLVGRLLGKEWEFEGDAVNYVFRWKPTHLEQIVRSYLVDPTSTVVTKRLWDHNVVIGKVVRRAPSGLQLPLAKAIYALLRPVAPLGNMMVGVILKNQAEELDPEQGRKSQSHVVA